MPNIFSLRCYGNTVLWYVNVRVRVSDKFCWTVKLELKSRLVLIASDLVLVNN